MINVSECECPLRPGEGSGNTHEQMDRLRAQWDREHGEHPWAKQRDALARKVMPRLEEEMRGRGAREWRMLQQMVGALCVLLVLGAFSARANDVPAGIKPEMWHAIESRAAAIARAFGGGACAEAMARLALWRTVDVLDNMGPTRLVPWASGSIAEVRSAGPAPKRWTDASSKEPGGAEERAVEAAKKACGKDGGDGGGSVGFWRFVDAHPDWETSPAFGPPLPGDFWRGVTAAGVGLGVAGEAAAGPALPLLVAPPLPTHTPAPTGREAL